MSSTNLEKPKIICETKDVVEKEVFKWTINNFKMRLNLNKRDNNKVSSEFTSDNIKDCLSGKYKQKWKLNLSTYSEFDPSSCSLVIDESYSSSLPTIYEASILSRTNENFRMRRYLDKTFFVNKVDLLDPANNLLPDDTLTIIFKVSVIVQTSTVYNEIQKFNIPKSPLCNELFLLSLKNDESFSDVILEVDGTDLKAHKIILAACSPVFSIMLKQKSMNEAQENRIIIKDMDLEVAKQMLEFIYTNKQPSRINEFANELMAASNKYEINRLKVMCEEILFNNITSNNAIKTLVYANMYGANNLKEAIINFIKNNPSVLESTEFKNLEEEIPSLAIETLRKICQK